jgi:hypothetical protein
MKEAQPQGNILVLFFPEAVPLLRNAQRESTCPKPEWTLPSAFAFLRLIVASKKCCTVFYIFFTHYKN